jgi:hypothetical protein
MHPHSFDSYSEGWSNENEDAAANAGLNGLRPERSGTLQMQLLADLPPTPTHSTMHRRKRRLAVISPSIAICALLAGSSTIPTAMAQSCISLADSTACPAFDDASISTGSTTVGLFPFLSSVENVTSFDSGIATYIAGAFAEQR